MRFVRILTIGLCLTATFSSLMPCQAGEGTLRGRLTARSAPSHSWNGNYYDPAWGMPLALVVPPTARAQTNYGWGVGNFRVTPIYNQFGATWTAPEGVYERGAFQPTPVQPSDTNQFGVYYVRGPW